MPSPTLLGLAVSKLILGVTALLLCKPCTQTCILFSPFSLLLGLNAEEWGFRDQASSESWGVLSVSDEADYVGHGESLLLFKS